MAILSEVIWLWGIVSAFLGVVGTILTVFDIADVRTDVVRWWRSRRAAAQAVRELLGTDHFIAHIVHVGGEFSLLYSMMIRINAEGGYYLRSPQDTSPSKWLVDVFWNRGGDLMLISPTELARRYGFRLVSFKNGAGVVTEVSDPNFCGLPIVSMKNEYEVRFERSPASNQNEK